MVAHACNPSTGGAEAGGSAAQGQPGLQEKAEARGREGSRDIIKNAIGPDVVGHALLVPATTEAEAPGGMT